MNKIITILIFITVNASTFATDQYTDKIIYNGKKYNLQITLLEKFFEKNPELKPLDEIQSTALHKGYVASFEIKNNQIFLTDIEVLSKDKDVKEGYPYKFKSVLNDIFPNSKSIQMVWFTGIVVIPYGKNLNYTSYERELEDDNYFVLEFENGNLNKEICLNNENYLAFKKEQYEKFKLTNEYKEVQNKIQERLNEVDVDYGIRQQIIKYLPKIY